MTAPVPSNDPTAALRRVALTGWLWAGAAPAALALALLWIPDPAPVSSPALRWTLTLIAAAGWIGSGLFFRAAIRDRMRTLVNVVGALRSGDYSIRLRGGGSQDPVGEIADELNALGEELRQERRAQREASALAGTVVQELGAGLFAFDARNRLVLTNRRGAQWLGRPAATLLEDDAETLGLAACLSGPPRQVLDIDLPRGPGRYEIRRDGFRSEGRSHTLLVLNDLTRALAAEERQAWRRMVQVLRHEINNSLAPIRSVAEMLRDRVARDRQAMPVDWRDDLEEGLDVVVSRTDALSRIVQSYKLLAELPPPERSVFSVADWVADVVRLENRQPVAVAPSDNVALFADRGQLDQLLLNLTRNAVDAALERRGDVTVRWRTSAGASGELILDVVDGGPGLSGRENLFVPFFSTKSQGTGIGLALSRQIAEAHGGRLTLENRTDGARGCIARLTLPLAPPKD